MFTVCVKVNFCILYTNTYIQIYAYIAVFFLVISIKIIIDKNRNNSKIHICMYICVMCRYKQTIKYYLNTYFTDIWKITANNL